MYFVVFPKCRSQARILIYPRNWLIGKQKNQRRIKLFRGLLCREAKMAMVCLFVCSPIKLIQEYSCTKLVRSYYCYRFGIYLTSKNINRKPYRKATRLEMGKQKFMILLDALKNSEMKKIAERIQEIKGQSNLMRIYNNQNRKPNHTTAPERH